MEIDLTPSVSIFKTYKNYKYTPASALGEYFDNSTSSFFENKTEIVDRRIYLIVDRRDKKNTKLHIVDNAYGMTKENFVRAVRIDDKKRESERNKFGVGLKVSAIWYSDVWSIETLEHNTNNYRKFVFDLNEIEKKDGNIFTAEETQRNSIGNDFGFSFNSGTILTLNNPRELPTRKHQINKIYKSISKQYANDIKEDGVKFHICELADLPNVGLRYIDLVHKYVSGGDGISTRDSIDELLAVEPEKVIWRKVDGKDFVEDFHMQIVDPMNEEKIYTITGVVGWIEKSGVGRGGVKRLWKKRALEQTLWTPKEVFGLANTIIAQRLYCELDFSEFEVSNSKDSFILNENLEYELIKKLGLELSDIKSKINDLNEKEKARKKQINLEKISKSFENSSAPAFNRAFENNQEVIKSTVIENKIIDEKPITEMFLTVGDKKVEIKTMISSDFESDDQLIKIIKEDDENLEYHFTININHPVIKNASPENIDNITKLIYLICRTDMELKVGHILHRGIEWFSSIKMINEVFNQKLDMEEISLNTIEENDAE